LFQGGRWKYTVAAAGALLSAILIRQVVHSREEAKAAHAAAQAAQDDNRVLTGAIRSADKAVTVNNAAKSAIHQRETAGLARTQTALDANAAWAQQPIPADVLASLRD